MEQVDRTVWISFSVNRSTQLITSMRYSIGTGPVYLWRRGMPWPKRLDNPILDGYTFCATESDREIYECAMEIDCAWPQIENWIQIKSKALPGVN